jgi:polyhydroxyalkanoate synthase
MGGLLALGLAALRPEDLRGLVLMATPWDFHAENALQARLTAAAVDSGPLGPIIDGFGELPVDIIQVMFAGFDPMGVARKFIAFDAMAAESEEEPGQDTRNSTSTSTARVEAFVSLEDWLNDGIPLPGPVARECISGWYGRNEPAQGRWRVGGKTVLPEEVNLPALVVLPEHDRIVPPLSALSLADALPRAERLMLPLGHIGMVVSARAMQLAWQPLTKWLQTTP